MSFNQPRGSGAVESVQGVTDNKNCSKETIKNRCNGNKYSQEFCDKIVNACPKGDDNMECNITSNIDDKKCLTCSEAYNKVCKIRNNVPSECNASTFGKLCPTTENFINIDNINHYDNILLYIVMLFIMYKIIYKK